MNLWCKLFGHKGFPVLGDPLCFKPECERHRRVIYTECIRCATRRYHD